MTTTLLDGWARRERQCPLGSALRCGLGQPRALTMGLLGCGPMETLAGNPLVNLENSVATLMKEGFVGVKLPQGAA